jgi:hypothetical protein
MTPAEAVVRLAHAEHGARNAYDGTFTAASDLANPWEVAGASNELEALALRAEFLRLAEAMQEFDVDAATIGNALDMVIAEDKVAEAARWLKVAEAILADAVQQRTRAQGMPENVPCTGCHADAQDAVNSAMGGLGMRQAQLQEALGVAADLCGCLRAGLYRRHGDLKEAHSTAPVRAAVREFY